MTQVALSGQYGYFGRTFLRDTRLPDGTDDESLHLAVTTLMARHHFGEGWSLDGVLPVGFVELSTPSAEAPARIAGLGDVQLGGRYDLAALWGTRFPYPNLTVGLRLGLPTGEQATVSPSPAVPPTRLAVGSGAWSFRPNLSVTQFVIPELALALQTNLMLPLSYAETNRRPGRALALAPSVLGFPYEGIALRAGLVYEARGYAEEQPAGTIINSGGTWLRVSGGATFALGDVLRVGLGAQVPVWLRVNGTQLAETVTINSTLAVVWGGGDDEHDHDHGHDDHGHDHDGDATTDGDVTELARGGESFRLEDAIVPGRVTVIDFWAEWCGPCAHVDETLRALAAEHPRLSVRRAEIVDFEQPIGREHFDGEGALPHLWIINGEGDVVDRFTESDPGAVRRRILRHLAP